MFQAILSNFDFLTQTPLLKNEIAPDLAWYIFGPKQFLFKMFFVELFKSDFKNI